MWPLCVLHDGTPLTETLSYGGDNPQDSSPSNRVVKDFANSEMSLFGSEDHLSFWSNSATTRDSCNSQESSKVKYQVGLSNLSIPDNLLQPEVIDSNLCRLPARENGAWIAASLPQKLEAAEATIQELREETLSWERQARKLRVEVETFRQQLAFESKNGSELKVKILAIEVERDSLKSEVEQLKALKGAPKILGGTDNHSRWEMEESKRMIRALQEEVLYEKDVSANLHVQLHKTQDSNGELLTALTELEETLEVSNKVIDKVTEANRRLQEELVEAHIESRSKMLEFEKVAEQVASLKTDLNFNISAKKTLEHQMNEVLVIKQELEVKVMDVEEHNKRLSEGKSSLEMQLTNIFKDQDKYRHDIGIANAERLDCERKVNGMQSRLTRLEQELQVATSDCTSMQEKCAAVETKMIQQQHEVSKKEQSLRAEIDCLLSCKKNFEQSANETEKALIVTKQEQAASIHLMQTKLDQLSLVVDEKEKVAMAEIADLHEEKLELESSLRHVKEKVKDLEKELSSQKDLEIKLEDLSKNLCSDLTQTLQEKESVLQEHLVNKKKQENEFMNRIRLLEEKLLHKAHAFSRTEKKLMLLEDDERSKESCNSSDSQHVPELQKRLRDLKEEANASKQQLVSCRGEFLQKETELMGKIECLELSSEQLAAALIDSEAEQLKKELIHLQKKNSFLSRKEQELLSSMHTQELLNEEVNRLQEANDLLEARLSKFIETAENPLPERIIKLETELGEAVEENIM